MKYSHIIWDFNGTLIDDLQYAIDTINTLLKRRGLKMIETQEEYLSNFDFPVLKYYENLGFDFSKESYDDVAVEWHSQYIKFAENATVFDDVRETIATFKNGGLKQIVLSATEISLLKKQLTSLKLTDEFSDLLALDNLYAASKVEIGKAWAEREKPKKALLIGDTTHDFEVACEIGVDCVLVARGHHGKKRLLACNCPVFNDLSEVRKYVFNN